MNRRKTLTLLFAASLVATVALVVVLVGPPPQRPAAEHGDAAASAAEDRRARERAEAERRTPRGASMRTPEEDRELQARLVLMLRHLYGDRISNTAVQILMAQVRIQVATLFPQDGAKRFEQILREAFPGQAAQILATLAKVDDFDRWMADSEDDLAALPPPEREKALLEKKRQLFGEQAAAELEAEARAAEERNLAMAGTMRVLEESGDMSLDQKLDTYREALRENYGDGPSAVALENSGLLAQTFFGLESVSRQLGELDPEARQQKINEIRRGFGLDEEQVRALEEEDREREARWQNGYAYMDERRALEGRYSGAELERQLAALRERYFGFEAVTIEREEADDFFRFERPRLYGRN